MYFSISSILDINSIHRCSKHINMPNTNMWIIFGPKREKVTEGCRKTIGTSQFVLSAQYYWDEKIVEYKMCRAGSMHGS